MWPFLMHYSLVDAWRQRATAGGVATAISNSSCVNLGLEVTKEKIRKYSIFGGAQFEVHSRFASKAHSFVHLIKVHSTLLPYRN